MNRFHLLLTLILIGGCRSSCPTKRSPHCNDWVRVVRIRSNDPISATHIRNLLKLRSIQCTFGVSSVCPISVPKEDWNRAVPILREDAKRRKYWIEFYEGSPRSYCPLDQPRNQVSVNMGYQQLLDSGRYPASSNLGAFLRHKGVQDQASTFKCVISMDLLKRDYLGSDAQWHTGYSISLEMATSLGEDALTSSMSGQAWDNGSQVFFQRGAFDVPCMK